MTVLTLFMYIVILHLMRAIPSAEKNPFPERDPLPLKGISAVVCARLAPLHFAAASYSAAPSPAAQDDNGKSFPLTAYRFRFTASVIISSTVVMMREFA